MWRLYIRSDPVDLAAEDKSKKKKVKKGIYQLTPSLLVTWWLTMPDFTRVCDAFASFSDLWLCLLSTVKNATEGNAMIAKARLQLKVWKTPSLPPPPTFGMRRWFHS